MEYKMSIFAGAFDNSEVISSSFAPIRDFNVNTEDRYNEKIREYADKEYVKKIALEMNDEKKLTVILNTREHAKRKAEECELKLNQEEAKKSAANEEYDATIETIQKYFILADDEEEIGKQQDILRYIGQKHSARIFAINGEIERIKNEKNEHDDLINATKELSDMLIKKWEENNPVEDRYLCKICYDNHVNRVIPVCGHTFCEGCIAKMGKKCEYCQKEFTTTNPIFLC